MELESVVKLIGCLVIAVIIFAIPCLATLALVLNWNVIVKYVLTMLSIGVIATMTLDLYYSLLLSR